MARISYVNGRYIPHAKAFVHIEDRGFQFADGIYEVIAMMNGVLIDANLHIERLQRSLKEISIKMPVSPSTMLYIIEELRRRNNNIKKCSVYIQVTRGVSPRAHSFPAKSLKPTLIITLNKISIPSEQEYENGISVITLPDIRWGRCDIKSISLLPNILAKQKAVEAGAKEAWFFEDKNVITEGSSSNCYIIDKSGFMRTYPENENVLGGVTRKVTLSIANNQCIKVKESPFNIEELYEAKEAFATSTTIGVMAVTKVNGKKIGTGKAGLITKKLSKLYNDRVRAITKK